MTWCWFARVDDVGTTPRPLAHAPAFDPVGAPAGTLAVWPAGRKPVASAVRMDARVVNPHGPAAFVSLVVLERDRSPLFDDPAVSGALRRVLAGPAPDAVSTFVRDSSHFAGDVTVRRAGVHALRDDPFARVGRAEILAVGPGLFGRTAPVPGPVIQRYAGQPWPVAGF